MSTPQSFILCVSCGAHRLAASQECPTCDRAPNPTRSSRSKMLAAALGVSLSLGVSVTGCNRPSPSETIYGGPPIEELSPNDESPVPPVDSSPDQGAAPSLPDQGSVPDAVADKPVPTPAPSATIYGAPPVDIYGAPPIDLDEDVLKPIPVEVDEP